MTTKKVQYHLEEARAVANDLISQFAYADVVDRIMIAGSIRRGKATVGDIELLCVPKRGEPATDLFCSPIGPAPDLLDYAIQNLIVENVLVLRPNKRGNTTYGPQNKLLIHVPSGIPLDVFSTTDQYWGMAFVVRTGPADFNIRAMTRFRHLGLRGHAYAGVTRGQPGSGDFESWDCPDERTVFNLLEWSYQEPEVRT